MSLETSTETSLVDVKVVERAVISSRTPQFGYVSDIEGLCYYLPSGVCGRRPKQYRRPLSNFPDRRRVRINVSRLFTPKNLAASLISSGERVYQDKS
jgi:hypothetical protein